MIEPNVNFGIPNDVFNKFEHVVVLMMENRSFDNLLGNLYHPQDLKPGQQFAGLKFGGPYYNSIPDYIKDGHAGEKIFTYTDTDLSQPYPDPGEEYPHINTQLYGELNPDNAGRLAYQMKKPYNLPNPIPCPAAMDGFVKDYISNLQSTFGGESTEKVAYEQYKVIMQCFENDQIPVLSTLAKEFAVFDHWFCSVPSQTWCNRSFWHAASSGGKVINPLEEYGTCFLAKIFDDFTEMESWVRNVWSIPTIFQRMNEQHISWNIYSHIAPLSLTTMVNGEFNHIKSFDSFQSDINNGSLPQYSFLEPQFLFVHNDEHPFSESKKQLPATLKLGEKLILDVYNAVRTSEQYRDNTLLIITFDEHGGCFDHVSPPCVATPPVPRSGQMGFPFNRPGIRVPMVMISSWIQPQTIVNEEFEHTSFFRGISEKWNLGTLSARDASVKAFTASNVFSTQKRSKPWPEILLKPEDLQAIAAVQEFDKDDDKPNHLQYAMLNALLYLEKKRGLTKTPRASVKTNGHIRLILNKLQEDMKKK
ncbi:MAG: alkaline phosphatase family protein [Bacteroidota bacterium]